MSTWANKPVTNGYPRLFLWQPLSSKSGLLDVYGSWISATDASRTRIPILLLQIGDLGRELNTGGISSQIYPTNVLICSLG